MKIVITGSLGHISKPLTQKLLAAGHHVSVITSKLQNVEAISVLGAHALHGSVEDVDFLTKAFTGADAVYTMVPPNFATNSWKNYIATIGNNFAHAIKNAGVKNVINLSSIGAHMPVGCGPVSGLFYSEKALNNLEDVNVMHLRPGYFYSNFLSSIPMVKNMGIIGGNYYSDSSIAMADTNDIAEVAFTIFNTGIPTGKNIRYIVSDVKTTTQIAKAIGKAIGKEDLNWIPFKDEDALNGMLNAGLNNEIATNYVEMGIALRSGEMGKEYNAIESKTYENTKLEDFAKMFAAAYSQN